MSDTLSLACVKHREYLWIGQLPYGEPEKAYLYTVPEEREKQQRFIKRHALCEPILLNDAAMERVDVECEFVEFEGDDEKAHPADAIHSVDSAELEALASRPIAWGGGK